MTTYICDHAKVCANGQHCYHGTSHQKSRDAVTWGCDKLCCIPGGHFDSKCIPFRKRVMKHNKSVSKRYTKHYHLWASNTGVCINGCGKTKLQVKAEQREARNASKRNLRAERKVILEGAIYEFARATGRTHKQAKAFTKGVCSGCVNVQEG